MFHHGYAPHYARHLRRFVADRNASYTVVEVGILKGTGLAVWSILFPESRFLDIEPSHYQDNLAYLKQRGAFNKGEPHVAVFDQFAPDAAVVDRLRDGRTIDIIIDDGFHSNEAILTTLECLKDRLSARCVYFIEDNHESMGNCTGRSREPASTAIAT